MQHRSYTRLAMRVGIFFGLAFAVCFMWYWVRGGGTEVQAYHLLGLKLAFFGFSGMNLISFVAGAVQSFVWGLIATGLWRLAGICCGSSASHGGADYDKMEKA